MIGTTNAIKNNGWKLVWVNANQTMGGSFAAQTIELNLSSYTEIMIAFHMGDQAHDALYYAHGFIGDYQTFTRVFMLDSTSYQARRSYQSSSSGIQFYDAYEGSTRSSGTGTASIASNGIAQPWYIYAR